MCLYEPINGDYPTESFCNLHGPNCEGCSNKYDKSLSEDYYKNKLYIRDADESKGHLCNSLNAESGGCFRMASACGKDGLYPVPKKQLETLGYYLERAQAVITYLREEVNRLEEENQND